MPTLPQGHPRRICRHGDPKCVTIKTVDQCVPLCQKCIEDMDLGILGTDVQHLLNRGGKVLTTEKEYDHGLAEGEEETEM